MSAIANPAYRRAVCRWLEVKQHLPEGTVTNPEFLGWAGSPGYSTLTPAEEGGSEVYYSVNGVRKHMELDPEETVELILGVGEYL